jgi:alpha-D-ribose 1-methylphosphonate 5-phosphate C-P lyase
MAQTFLGSLRHKNQSMEGLGRQAFGILQVLGKRLANEKIAKKVRLNTQFVRPIKVGKRFALVSDDNPEIERPQLNSNFAYRWNRLKSRIKKRFSMGGK